MTAPSPDPKQALDELRDGVSRLATDLYRLETEADLKVLCDGSALTGASAALAGDAPAAVRSLWERYPLLTDSVDRLEGAVAADDSKEARKLVGPARDLLATLRTELDRVLAAGERLGSAWREVIPRIDAAAEQLAATNEVAGSIGVGREPTLLAARHLVDQLTATAATDPLSVDPDAAEEAVARARHRVDELAAQRTALPSRLAASHVLLEELDRLVPEGGEALEVARAKIADPVGLLEPLDPAQLDAGTNGLRPWLARLEALAERGSWLPAVEGLDRWDEVAHGWLSNARAVVVANRAPMERRSELRGLLDAYAAKAGATGLAEDAALAALYEEAHNALYTAPCHLDGAADLVARYGQAVRDGEEPEARAPRVAE
jgi:hypothetical protein